MTLQKILHTNLFRCSKCGRSTADITHSCAGSLGDVVRVAVGCQALSQASIAELNRLWKTGWRNGSMAHAVDVMLRDHNGENRVRGRSSAEAFIRRAIETLGQSRS